MSYSNFYARFHGFRQRVLKSLGEAFRFQYSLHYIIVVVAFQILAWLQAVFIKKTLTGDFLVLHYNVDFGVDYVNEPVRIFLWPIFALLVFFVNVIILAFVSRNKDFKLFAHLLFISSALIGLLLNAVLLSIYLINFR